MKKIAYVLGLVAVVSALVAFSNWKTHWTVEQDTKISDLLVSLGDSVPLHYIPHPDPAKVLQGKELVQKGWTTHQGKKSKVVSRFFVCTDCHNTLREDEHLKQPTPQGRLRYVQKHQLPFLQATTLWGSVNRETWYNDDYIKKYGDLVKPAKHNLQNAVQLCAQECSQGRELEAWELEAMVHYLNTIDVRLGDLGLNPMEERQLADPQVSGLEKITLLKTKYSLASRATFVEPIPAPDRALGLKGDAAIGQLVYESSCLHCHQMTNDATNFKLDDSKLTFKKLRAHLKKSTAFSVYQITRNGTKPGAGQRGYMPHYTAERLSDEQIEGLAAYINLKSNK